MAEAHRIIGVAQYRLGQVDAALASYRQALSLQIKAKGERSPEVAATLSNIGVLEKNKGDYPAALTTITRALSISEETQGRSSQVAGTIRIVLGDLQRLTGRLSEADETLAEAAETLKAYPAASVQRGMALANRSLVLLQRLESVAARGLQAEAVGVFEKALGPDHPYLADALRSLGATAGQLGDYVEAEKYFLRAQDIIRAKLGERTPQYASILDYLGFLRQEQGRLQESAAQFKASWEICQEVQGPEHPQGLSSAVKYAELLGRLRKPEEGDATLAPLLAILERNEGSREVRLMALQTMSLLTKWQERLNDSLNWAVRARQAVGELHGPESRRAAEIMELLADLQRERGAIQETISLSRQAFALRRRDLDNLAQAGAERSKQAYWETWRFIWNNAISLGVAEAPGNPDARKLALEAALRLKTRVLDAQASELAAVRRSTDPESRWLLDELTKTRRLRAQLNAREYPEQASELDQRQEKLERSLSAVAATQRALRTLGSAEFQQALPAHAVYLEIVAFEPLPVKGRPWLERAAREFAIIAVTREKTAAFRLGDAAAWESRLGSWRASLASRDGAIATRAAGRLLADAILRPVASLLTGKSLLIVSPEGEFAQIPFAALPRSGNRLLGDDFAVCYVNSGRDLAALPTESEPDVPVIVVNPDYSSFSATNLPITPLPGTELEGRSLARLLPDARLLSGSEASERALKQLSSPPRILHVATHGFFSDGSTSFQPSSRSLVHDVDDSARDPMLRSGLVLARDNAGSEDGVLTALEASTLRLNGTNLVVLSACETGRGQSGFADGVFGLRRAFAMAGARSLVMSLWKVDDQATAEFMAGLYRELASGAPLPQAMRRAQLHLRRQSRFRHPYFWSGFVASGDYRMSLKKTDVVR